MACYEVVMSIINTKVMLVRKFERIPVARLATEEKLPLKMCPEYTISIRRNLAVALKKKQPTCNNELNTG